MTRKKLLLVFIFLLIVSTFAACDSSHMHNFGDGAITTAPTMEDEGVYTRYCTQCDFKLERKIPALSDAETWTVETVASTHKVQGTSTYTSVYGEVVVKLDLVPHAYGDEYTIVTKPTATDKGTATRDCECGEKENVDVPALSDTTVWTVTTVESTHTVKGTSTYTSVYGTVVVELDLVPHAYGAYTITVEPTATTKGSATRTCTCEAVETVDVPVLTDTTVWTASVTTEPTYNAKGVKTYTSVYGTVTEDIAKLKAPYDGKTYYPINFDASDDDVYKVGVINADTVWGNAFLSIDANSCGEGKAYPFMGGFRYEVVNALTGEIKIISYEAKTEKVWVPDEDSMDPEAGDYVDETVKDENGNVVYDYTKVKNTFTAWVDFATGLIVAPRFDTFDDVNLYTPFETVALSKGTAIASSWNNSIAITYTVDGVDYNVFVYKTRAYFGVSYLALDGTAIEANACYAAKNLIVKNSDGKVIVSFANDNTALIPADGLEGNYVCGEDALYVSGVGLATLNGVSATYVKEDGYIGLYVDGEYFEVTLSGATATYTADKPMVTITFDAGDKTTVEPITVNKNIKTNLPTPTHDEYTFKGWLTADGESVDLVDYIPTASVTLYANWKAKVVINLNGVLDGDATVIYLGDGDVIGDFLPEYDVEEAVGKVFRGWYLDADFETALPEEAEVSEDDSGFTIYAKWDNLPAYYGTYKGVEVLGAAWGNGSSATLTIDENGVISGKYTGVVVSYDEATQKITWKKKATDTATYGLWLNTKLGVVATHYSSQAEIGTDYYIFSKYNTTDGKLNAQYGIQVAKTDGGTPRGCYARLINIKGPNGDTEIFVLRNYIYDEFTATDAEGNPLTAATVKDSKTLIVKDKDGNTLISVASQGTSFANKQDTVDLDAYFGTYTNGDEIVILDGVGNITYGDKTGTYTAVTGKDYGFDVYLEEETEYYRLTLNGKAFTMIKPMANLVLKGGDYVADDTKSLNINVPYTLPTLTCDTQVFNGWFYDEDCTNPVGDSIVLTQDTTLYPLWKVKVVLTVVYNNGDDDGTQVYSLGDIAKIELPVYKKHALVGWYTTADFEEGTLWTNESEITENLTVYAKWEAAPIYNLDYATAELDGNSANGGVSGFYARNAIVKIDPYGNGTGTSWPFSGAVSVQNYDAVTGYLELVKGTDVYYGYIDAATGIMILNDQPGKVAMDEIIFMNPFETANKSASYSGSYWNSGKSRTIQYTYSGTTYSAFVYDNNVYFGVSFKDAKGNAVEAKDCYKSKTLYVYASDGTTLIAKFAHDGDTLQPMDGYEGTYTVSDDAVVIIDGVKTATIGGVEGTYAKAEEGASYTHCAYVDGCYYEITLDKVNYTAVVNKPMVTITFDADGKATVAPVTTNKNIQITLSTPENDEYIFRAWYLDADLTEVVDNDYIPTETLTLHAKWDVKVTLTVIYGNGLDNAVLNYGANDTVAPQEPAFTDGKVFDGWYLDETYATPYTVGVITENTVIYCKWKDAVDAYGEYKGFNLFGDSYKSWTSYNSNLQITADGAVTGTKSGKYTAYDPATGAAAKIGSNYAYYNADLGIMATAFSSNSASLGTDMYILFKEENLPDKVEQSHKLLDTSVSAGNKYCVILKVTKGEDVYYLLVMDDTIKLANSVTTSSDNLNIGNVRSYTNIVVTLSDGTVKTFTKDAPSTTYYTVA